MVNNKNKFGTIKTSKNNNSFKLRNKRIVGIFTSRGFNIRLIGEDNPKFILDDKFILSCTVNNFNLLFLKSFTSPNVVKSIDFKNDIYISEFELNEIIRMCEHQPVFRIQLKNTEMCIVGYNYDEDIDLKYPVFASAVPWLYLSKVDAEIEQERLIREGYNVEII